MLIIPLDKLCAPKNRGKYCIITHREIIGIYNTSQEAFDAPTRGITLTFQIGSVDEVKRILNSRGFEFYDKS